jgi:hypothetical protein
MTLTMAYEFAVPKQQKRHFTPDEDDAIQRMAAEGHTTRQIAAALNRQVNSVLKRARMLNVVISAGRPGHRIMHMTTGITHCRRCTILLAAAPAGHDGFCGWCVGCINAA